MDCIQVCEESDNFPPTYTREDVGVLDQDLVMMSPKDLNRLLKKRGIPKERQKEIKKERRTLKNRGYAANSRVKREKEEMGLGKCNEIKRLEIEAMVEEAKRVQMENKRLQEYDQDLQDEIERLREEEKTYAMESQAKSYLKHLPDIKIEKVPDEL